MTFQPINARVQQLTNFFQLQEILFDDPVYREKLDSNCRIAYTLLYHRQHLSIQKGWQDKDGNVFCYYSVEKLARKMNVSESTIKRLMVRLKEVGLIDYVRVLHNKPNQIYVGLPVFERLLESGEVKLTCPGGVKLTPELYRGINTEKNYNVISLREADGRLFTAYAIAYKNHTGKEHPPIKLEQFDRVQEQLDIFRWDDGEVSLVVEHHFDSIPDSNDGNINAFARAMERYDMEVLDNY